MHQRSCGARCERCSQLKVSLDGADSTLAHPVDTFRALPVPILCQFDVHESSCRLKRLPCSLDARSMSILFSAIFFLLLVVDPPVESVSGGKPRWYVDLIEWPIDHRDMHSFEGRASIFILPYRPPLLIQSINRPQVDPLHQLPQRRSRVKRSSKDPQIARPRQAYVGAQQWHHVGVEGAAGEGERIDGPAAVG